MESSPQPFPKRRTLRRGEDLAAAGLAAPGQAALIDRAGEIFPVAVTPHLADSMHPGDALSRQFIPEAAELAHDAGDRADPIGDRAHSPVKGIVHRYPDRVLLTPLLVCPAYCRFCFRRENVGGSDAILSEAELDAAFAYIERHPEIWEVILSGGDPLMLPAKRLSAIVARISAIPHVAAIRVHTRVPVIEPARIAPALVAALATEKGLFVVIHCNHPNELNAPALAACRSLIKAGIPLLSQTVLLKGVNDDAETLAALMRALVANRIKPYYLHHPDLAPGTGHFRLPLERGQELAASLRGRISGLCQPSYVLDIPGGYGKVPAGPSYVERAPSGHSVTDWQGRRHAYPPAPETPAEVARDTAT
jgi:lysine 2,3-aminomutase